MRFNNKEIQFFEIEKRIHDLYTKLKSRKNKKILNDLNFLFKEENLVFE